MFAPAAETDPIALYLRLTERARAEGIDTAPAALGTAAASGHPSVRIVLIRNVDTRGFVFFTNYESRKGRELAANPRAALCQHWPTLRNRCEWRVPSNASTPPNQTRTSRGGRATASSARGHPSKARSSRHVPCWRRALARSRESFADQPVVRPPFWGGFRIVPDRIEFWYGRAGRLHERMLYTRTPGDWKTSWLFP